ncbi:MAG: hypothetical protein HC842_06765 [Cytophagales bacterium]|nr:hypothetical protein [Cytophagales bacterium]
MKNKLHALSWCLGAALIYLGPGTSHAQNISQAEKYLFADFSSDPFSDTLWSLSGTNATAIQTDDKLDISLEQVPSYTIFYSFELDNTLNLSENANLEIRYQGTVTGCGSCALFFILEDANGNQTGDHWRIQENIPQEYTTFTKEMGHPDVPAENVDFSQIKKLHIRSQSHDGSWGNANVDGNIEIDYLKLGSTPQDKLTASSFETHFFEESDDYVVNLQNGALSSLSNGKLIIQYDNTPGWEPIFEIDFEGIINLSNNATFEARFINEWICPENAAECRLHVRLIDVGGNTSGDDWQTYIYDWNGTAFTWSANFSSYAGAADLTRIDKILFRSGTRDESWGGVNMSGQLSLDYIKLGTEATGPVAVPKIAKPKFLVGGAVIDGQLDESWNTASPIKLET